MEMQNFLKNYYFYNWPAHMYVRIPGGKKR